MFTGVLQNNFCTYLTCTSIFKSVKVQVKQMPSIISHLNTFAF